MNILIPDSWLREYLETKATPKQLKDCLSLCGPSVEKINCLGNDYVYDIEVTTNRPDMMSVLGIAREAAAILPRFNIGAKLNNETMKPFDYAQGKQSNNETIEPKKELPLKVKIESPKLCPRFTAIILDGVKVKPSPRLIQNRLSKSGIRALNNVIDTSNYLMRLFGQPVHTFDYDKIKKATMNLRESRKGEKITTLDGKTFTLPGGDIVIEDGEGRLIDLCGIMGGENTEIDKNTKRVLLFVQVYNPARIRKTSTALGQRTEAATLFEKGLETENVLPTILYGIKLLKDIAEVKPASKLIDIYPNPYKGKIIKTNIDFINSHLGIKLSKKEIIEILDCLGFTNDLSRKNKKSLKISVPSSRAHDVSIPEDLVEEVARIYGYHNLPSRLMTGEIPIKDKCKDFEIELEVKRMLKYWGFTETYHYSFVSKNLIEKVGLSVGIHLKIANPLTEETEYMRISLVPSLLQTVETNQHFQEKLSLFELAKVYIPKPNDLPEENSHLVIVNQSSFLDLKGIVEQMFNELGISQSCEATEVLAPRKTHFTHPKQTILFLKNKDVLAKVGKIHPQLATSFNIKQDLFIAEIDLDKLVKYYNPIKKYTPIPLYPSAVEDLTLIFPPETHFGVVVEEIYKIDSLINKVELIDRYKDTLTLSITYLNPKKSLAGEEIRKLREKILSNLKDKFNIHLKQTSK